MKRPRPSAGRSHLAELHTTFLVIVPRVELHGRPNIRRKNPDNREELIAEMLRLCWR